MNDKIVAPEPSIKEYLINRQKGSKEDHSKVSANAVLALGAIATCGVITSIYPIGGLALVAGGAAVYGCGRIAALNRYYQFNSEQLIHKNSYYYKKPPYTPEVVNFDKLERMIRSNHKENPFFAKAGRCLLRRVKADSLRKITHSEYDFLNRVDCLER